MKNRQLPLPSYTVAGQYKTETEAHRYAALLDFVRSLSFGSDCPAGLQSSARELVQKVEETTYIVQLRYPDGLMRCHAISCPTPVSFMDACNKALDIEGDEGWDPLVQAKVIAVIPRPLEG